MVESMLLPGSLLLATVALGVLAAVSLPGSAPTAPRPRTAGVRVRVLCPTVGDMARVSIGVDPATGNLSVVACQYFEDAAITCDRGCIPPELAAVA